MGRPKLDVELRTKRIALGSQLRQEREDVGLSQQALADILNVKKIDVQRFESGEKSIPAELIAKISHAIADGYAHGVKMRLTDSPTANVA